MGADSGAAAIRPDLPLPKISILTALAIETQSVAPLLSSVDGIGVELRQSGPGPERAAAAAADAIAGGAGALLSWGYAGALDPDLEPGTVVVPVRVRSAERDALAADTVWQAALADAFGREGRVSTGDLWSAAAPLGTPAAKASAYAATSAVAVDMESAAIARAADEAGLPWAAVRVIVDGAGDMLPANVGRFVDPTGGVRYVPVLAALLSPRQWRVLGVLARRNRAARVKLGRLAERLAPAGFGFPGARRR